MRQRYYNPVSYVDPFGLSPILEQEAGNNTIHKILAIAGFLPVVGGVADALDAMLYLAEGDKEGAFTAIMAMTCGGVASVMITRSVSKMARAAKTLSNVAELPKSASLVRKVANTFSNSGSFMKRSRHKDRICHGQGSNLQPTSDRDSLYEKPVWTLHGRASDKTLYLRRRSCQ